MRDTSGVFEVPVGELMSLLNWLTVLIHPSQGLAKHMGNDTDGVDGGVGDYECEELLGAIENV